MPTPIHPSGIRDNCGRGPVADFLFGEPSCVNRLAPSKTETKHFLIYMKEAMDALKVIQALKPALTAALATL